MRRGELKREKKWKKEVEGGGEVETKVETKVETGKFFAVRGVT